MPDLETINRLNNAERAMRDLTRDRSAAEAQDLADAHARADSVAAHFGEKASPPTIGESPLNYRRRMLATYSRHSPRFKDSRFGGADRATLDLIEPEIYSDAVANIRSDAAPGILVPHERKEGGRIITEYSGDILGFMGPFMSGAVTGRINTKG